MQKSVEGKNGSASEVIETGVWGVERMPVRAEARLASGDAVVLTVVGDVDDLTAALDVGLMRGEMAILGLAKNEAGWRVYRLKSITDEPAWLEVRWPAGQTAQVEIGLRAVEGWWGPSERMKRLVSAMAERLEQLCGVDTAPL